MKIETNPASRRLADKIAKEVIWWTHRIMAVPVLFLLAAMVPGDRVHANTVGAVTMVIVCLIADALITVPAYIIRARTAAPVLAPVSRGGRW